MLGVAANEGDLDRGNVMGVGVVIAGLVAAVGLYQWRSRVQAKRKSEWLAGNGESHSIPVRLHRGIDPIGRIEITQVFEVEEYEYEGHNYYCLLADGGVVFLGGQHFCGGFVPRNLEERELFHAPFAFSGTEPEQADCRARLEELHTNQLTFPCTSYDADEHLGSGEHIPPLRTFPPYKREVGLWIGIPSHGDVIDLSWDELQEKLELVTEPRK